MTMVTEPLKILHTYKVDRGDLEGGVPSVTSVRSREVERIDRHHVLVAGTRGCFGRDTIDGYAVEAVGSLVTLSRPLWCPPTLLSFVVAHSIPI